MTISDAAKHILKCDRVRAVFTAEECLRQEGRLCYQRFTGPAPSLAATEWMKIYSELAQRIPCFTKNGMALHLYPKGWEVIRNLKLSNSKSKISIVLAGSAARTFTGSSYGLRTIETTGPPSIRGKFKQSDLRALDDFFNDIDIHITLKNDDRQEIPCVEDCKKILSPLSTILCNNYDPPEGACEEGLPWTSKQIFDGGLQKRAHFIDDRTCLYVQGFGSEHLKFEIAAGIFEEGLFEHESYALPLDEALLVNSGSTSEFPVIAPLKEGGLEGIVYTSIRRLFLKKNVHLSGRSWQRLIFYLKRGWLSGEEVRAPIAEALCANRDEESIIKEAAFNFEITHTGHEDNSDKLDRIFLSLNALDTLSVKLSNDGMDQLGNIFLSDVYNNAKPPDNQNELNEILRDPQKGFFWIIGLVLHSRAVSLAEVKALLGFAAFISAGAGITRLQHSAVSGQKLGFYLTDDADQPAIQFLIKRPMVRKVRSENQLKEIAYMKKYAFTFTVDFVQSWKTMEQILCSKRLDPPKKNQFSLFYALISALACDGPPIDLSKHPWKEQQAVLQKIKIKSFPISFEKIHPGLHLLVVRYLCSLQITTTAPLVLSAVPALLGKAQLLQAISSTFPYLETALKSIKKTAWLKCLAFCQWDSETAPYLINYSAEKLTKKEKIELIGLLSVHNSETAKSLLFSLGSSAGLEKNLYAAAWKACMKELQNRLKDTPESLPFIAALFWKFQDNLDGLIEEHNNLYIDFLNALIENKMAFLARKAFIIGTQANILSKKCRPSQAVVLKLVELSLLSMPKEPDVYAALLEALEKVQFLKGLSVKALNAIIPVLAKGSSPQATRYFDKLVGSLKTNLENHLDNFRLRCTVALHHSRPDEIAYLFSSPISKYFPPDLIYDVLWETDYFIPALELLAGQLLPWSIKNLGYAEINRLVDKTIELGVQRLAVPCGTLLIQSEKLNEDERIMLTDRWIRYLLQLHFPDIPKQFVLSLFKTKPACPKIDEYSFHIILQLTTLGNKSGLENTKVVIDWYIALARIYVHDKIRTSVIAYLDVHPEIFSSSKIPLDTFLELQTLYSLNDLNFWTRLLESARSASNAIKKQCWLAYATRGDVSLILEKGESKEGLWVLSAGLCAPHMDEINVFLDLYDHWSAAAPPGSLAFMEIVGQLAYKVNMLADKSDFPKGSKILSIIAKLLKIKGENLEIYSPLFQLSFIELAALSLLCEPNDSKYGHLVGMLLQSLAKFSEDLFSLSSSGEAKSHLENFAKKIEENKSPWVGLQEGFQYEENSKNHATNRIIYSMIFIQVINVMFRQFMNEALKVSDYSIDMTLELIKELCKLKFIPDNCISVLTRIFTLSSKISHWKNGTDIILVMLDSVPNEISLLLADKNNSSPVTVLGTQLRYIIDKYFEVCVKLSCKERISVIRPIINSSKNAVLQLPLKALNQRAVFMDALIYDLNSYMDDNGYFSAIVPKELSVEIIECMRDHRELFLPFLKNHKSFMEGVTKAILSLLIHHHCVSECEKHIQVIFHLSGLSNSELEYAENITKVHSYLRSKALSLAYNKAVEKKIPPHQINILVEPGISEISINGPEFVTSELYNSFFQVMLFPKYRNISSDQAKYLLQEGRQLVKYFLLQDNFDKRLLVTYLKKIALNPLSYSYDWDLFSIHYKEIVDIYDRAYKCNVFSHVEETKITSEACLWSFFIPSLAGRLQKKGGVIAKTIAQYTQDFSKTSPYFVWMMFKLYQNTEGLLKDDPVSLEICKSKLAHAMEDPFFDDPNKGGMIKAEIKTSLGI